MEATLGILSILWVTTLFVYSGSMKVVDFEASRAAVLGYRLVPDRAAGVIGSLLPAVELATSVLLIVAATRTTGAIIAAGLGATFAVAAATALVRGLDVSCGCAGRNGRLNRLTFIRAVTLVVAAAAVITLSPALDTVVAGVAAALALVPAGLLVRQRLVDRRARGHRSQAGHVYRRASEAEVAELAALIARPPSGPAPVALPVVAHENA